MIFGNSLLCRLCVIIFLSPVVYSQALDKNVANSGYLHSNFTLRIVNGVLAPQAQFPYQVSIRFINHQNVENPVCGGAILNSMWVITAAHCLTTYQYPELRPRLRIVAGTIRMYPPHTEYHVRRAAQLIIHASYRKNHHDARYDLGLILVDKSWKFNSRSVKPIKPLYYSVPAKTKCTVSGWGAEVWGGYASESLQYTEQYLYDNDFCNTLVPKNINFKFTKETICAGNLPKFTGICTGDSGGPLVCDNRLAGVVSTSLSRVCGQEGIPHVYTSIKYYWPWIEAIMKFWTPKKFKDNLNKGQMKTSIAFTLHGSSDSFRRIVNLLFLLCIVIVQVY